MRWKESERDPESFARAVSVFAGERIRPDGLACKALRFLLEPVEGCDGLLAAARFEVCYGWHPARHPYFQSVAPAALSYLADQAGARPGASEVQAVIGPGPGPSANAERWSFGRRRIWLRAAADQITFHIRDAQDEDAALAAQLLPLPEPIDFVRRSMAFPAPVACPHCGTPAASFRHLETGSLVCASCGRSFEVDEAGRP